jgi:hypothetical protein
VTSEERAKRVRNYFAEPPKVPLKDFGKAALGLILIIVGIHLVFLLLVGLVILVWGGIGIARYAIKLVTMRPKATGAQMDAWLEEALIPAALTGATRLNIHPTELTGSIADNRLIFVGYPNPDVVPDVKGRRGDDKRMRYSLYEILVVFLSNWRLPVYQVNYDMEAGVTILENTKEYNLGQVDGIETSNDRINILNTANGKTKDGKQIEPSGAIGHVTTAQILSLMVSGNQAVTLITGVTGSESVRIENVGDPSKIDSGISRLREHLRIRHQGAYPAGVGLPGAGGPVADDLGLDLPPQAAPRSEGFRPGPDSPTMGPGL